MPRTTTVESPGCPPLRALTADVLGLVKVIQANGGQDGGAAKVVERWGEPDASKCVLATSILDRETDPLLGVARKCGSVDIISAITGNLHASIPSLFPADEDSVIGLHLFRKHQSNPSPRSFKIHACTTKGLAVLTSTEPGGDHASHAKHNVCGRGNILCSKVDESENYAIYGGKGVEVNAWDLQEGKRIWAAKSPPVNSLGIFTPTFFTSVSFLCKDDHRKFVAGTGSHQVRLYDISSQRRPVLSVDFRETPIKAVDADIDGQTVYVGNASGDLASFDMRTGKLLGCFTGKCSGSIRSISRHPQLPVIASCGLDCYLRIWNVKSRQLLSDVFLKQHLTSVVFDSHFQSKADQSAEVAVPAPALDMESVELETTPFKRKKFAKGKSRSKKSKSMSRGSTEDEEDED